MVADTSGNVMSDSSAHTKSCPKCGAELPAEAPEGLCTRCLMAEAMQPTAPKPATGAWKPPSPAELQALMQGYTVEKLLGKGGMGAVYKGVQENLDRPVAIKIISNVLDEADASYGERFKNEARAMAKLNHPGIVAVHDYGETANGILYIVMEYIEGTDVARMIAQQGRLHTDHAMAISAHVCDALAYAHERGIIHRDIKPANIMVSNDGVVKVADFGLAKMTKSGESGLTQSGMAMGTLHYMAPEALMLGAAVDHRADIYAVGVMLYQMLTGKVPHGMFELPSMQVPGLDPRYDAIIAQAMREDRDIRYQSVRELRGSLDHILTQPVVQVDPQATRAAAAVPPQGGRPTTQVHRTAGQPFRPPQSQVVYVEKKSSSLPWGVVVVVLGVAGWFVLGRSKPAHIESKHTGFIAGGADAKNAQTRPPADSSGTSTTRPATATKDQPSGTSGTVQGSQSVKPAAKATLVSTDWMDVMPLIDPVKNAQLPHRLSWTRTPAGFECKRVDDQLTYSGCLQIPVPVLPNYAIEAEVTAGSAYSVGITVPVGDGARTTCWIVADRNKVAGIGKIDGKDPWDKTFALGCATPFKMESGRRYKLDAEVRRVPEGVNIQFSVDGKLVGAYRGPTNRLSVCSCWNKGGDPGLIDFGANDTATFHAVKIRALLDVPSTGTVVAEGTSVSTDWTDALILVDPSKHANVGSIWERTAVGIEWRSNEANVNERFYAGTLQLPIALQPSYAVEIEFTSPVPSHHMGILLPLGDGHNVACHFSNASFVGIAKIGTKEPNESVADGAASPFEMMPNQRYLARAEVRRAPDGIDIQFFVGGKLMGKYHGPNSRLKLSTVWRIGGDRNHIMLASNRAVIFHSARVKGLKDLDGKAPSSTFFESVTVLPTVPELLILHQQFAKLQAERVTAVFEADVAKLNSGYLGGLDREVAKERTAGRLDGVLALEAEKKLISGKQPVPATDDTSTSAIVKSLRSIYRDSYAKLEVARAANLKALTDPLVPRLKALEGDLAKQNRIADAKAVREYREKLPAQESTAADRIAVPFINSLGMKFVPVPGTKVKFCIHETRKVDFANFAFAVAATNASWKNVRIQDGLTVSASDDHPVVNVSWEEATAFCAWLSNKEGKTYRLPTDREWSIAVGIGTRETSMGTPESRSEKLKDIYPWGTQWPPPASAGNYADATLANRSTTQKTIPGYTDGHATTAPVMSFPPNALGIHDLGGNVWEFCSDAFSTSSKVHVLRGGSWGDAEQHWLLSSSRDPFEQTGRYYIVGFRCVLEATGP